jgi:hypothetical protein
LNQKRGFVCLYKAGCFACDIDNSTEVSRASVFLILFSLFFVQKKSLAKEVKKRAVLSLCHFCFKLKLLAPPRVRFLPRQKLLGTTAHFRHSKVFDFCEAIPRLAVPPNVCEL